MSEDANMDGLPGDTSIATEDQPIDTTERIHYAGEPGVLSMLQSLGTIITVALFILTFIVQPFRIPSASMQPALMVGDFLLVNKQVYGPPGQWGWLLPYSDMRRGEIAVFHYPVDPAMHLVKRVIGLPGDRLRLGNGRVYINGAPLKEPYTFYQPSRPDYYRDNFPQMEEADPAIETRWWIQMRSLVQNGELTVPPGSYFVMGDNRNDSDDSRYWGFVPRSAVVGEPLLIYLSLRDSDAETPLPKASGQSSSPLQRWRWDRVLKVVR